ncbi:MAG: hypothetical protein M3280_00425 [Actinomycetota bacterium]|nr:hypothetical protein [Actinomycetota bacterium]
MDDQSRAKGVAIDLERLEAHAEEIFLTRFVEAVKEARGEHGRFLILRAGDELAIRSAADGSFELLSEVRAEPTDLE